MKLYSLIRWGNVGYWFGMKKVPILGADRPAVLRSCGLGF